MWIGYAKSGKELDVQEAIQELGFTCHCAKKIEAVRTGKNRRPEPKISPVLPNYLFIDIHAEDFLELSNVKHLSQTKYLVPQTEQKRVMDYLDPLEKAFTRDKSEIEAKQKRGERLEEFEAGQEIQVIAGSLQGIVANFARIVEVQGIEMAEVEIDMLGKKGKVPIDVLDVSSIKK